MSLAPKLTTLDALAAGRSATVIHLAPSAAHDRDSGTNMARRLMELGFVPGEKIRMLKRGLPGGDPLAVKVGQSTFALRRFEAALITIDPE
ncbi:MAG: ferrous iron transport protein A [Pseudomonadota bacterium]